MTPEIIAEHVAAAFGEDATTLTTVNRHSGRRRTARLTWVYLCVAYLPLPDTYPARDGGRRRRGERDGNVKTVGRIAGTSAQAVRYALRRIEDLRDDPEFDAKVWAIEQTLDALTATR